MIHFTPREKEILKGLNERLTNEEIRLLMKPNAQNGCLNVDHETFNIHIRNIYKKLKENGYELKGKTQYERRQILLAYAHYYQVRQSMKDEKKI